jgi:hypothetical protein
MLTPRILHDALKAGAGEQFDVESAKSSILFTFAVRVRNATW